MFRFVIGMLAGIAFVRYLSDEVVTDAQREQIARNARELLRISTDTAREAAYSISE